MKFAERCNALKPSAIREVGKMIAARENIISFAAGLPDASLFPLEALTSATNHIMKDLACEALQYGPTQGHLPLRKKIAERMSAVGVKAEIENIQITSGSQQAISFCSMMLLNPEDTLMVENPSYLGALTAFGPLLCDIQGIDMDEDGLRLDILEEVMKNNPKARVLYTVPTFQNPTGRTLSLDRRKKLVELANQYDMIIVEDNPYGELRYAGEEIPAIKSFDTEGRVIYLGSFSKVLCPGLRVGWICCEAEMRNKLEIFKQGGDLQSSQFGQVQIDTYLNHHNIDEHIGSIQDVYDDRRKVMLNMIKEHFPKEVKYTNPEGGMFVWMELPEGLDAMKLLDQALESGVAYVPGEPFYPNKGKSNTMRLSFSTVSADEVEKGMKILSNVVNEAWLNLERK